MGIVTLLPFSVLQRYASASARSGIEEESHLDTYAKGIYLFVYQMQSSDY